MEGLFAGLIVHLFTLVSRTARARSLFKPVHRRFMSGLLVCFLCISAKFYFPPLRLVHPSPTCPPIES